MKKLLALVLALVMVLGLATVGTSAAYSDFTDTADVSYEEAMKVMNAVGVFVGDNGKLNPKGNLTRAQAAKLVAYLALGEDIAEALPKTGSKFTDAPDGAWFTGYVNYMANEGYTDGTSPTTFSPNGTLTGYQFGAFLLAVLGYDRELEGMTGSGWETKVAVKLEELDITKGVSKLGSAALTREEAAQFCLNALKADTVKYTDKGTTIDINGAKITTGAKSAEAVKSESADGRGAIKNEGAGNYVIQLGEKLYKGDLALTPGATDAQGRPSTQWTYDTEDVGTFADSADKTYTVAKDTTVASVLTDGGKLGLSSSRINADAKLVINGYTVNTYAAFDTEVPLQVGDEVEVFYDSSDHVKTVVVSRYFAAEIDKVVTNLSTSYANQGAKYSIRLTDAENASYSPAVTLYDAYKDDAAKELPGFDAATYVEDAVIAVVPKFVGGFANGNASNSVILASYLATSVEGKVTNYKSAASEAYITLDGTKYITTDVTAAGITTLSFTNNYKLFLSKNNNIIAFDGSNSAVLEDVYYVDGIYFVKSNTNTSNYYAVVVGLDGVKKEIKLEANAYATMAAQTTLNELASAHFKLDAAKASELGDTAVYSPVTFTSTTGWNANQNAGYNQYLYLKNDQTWTSQDQVAALQNTVVDTSKTYYVKAVVGEKELLAVNALYSFKDTTTNATLGTKSGNGKFDAEQYLGSDSFTYIGKTAANNTGATVNANIDRKSISLTTKDGSTVNGTLPGAKNATGTQYKKLYFTGDTKFIAVEGSGDDMTIKTATGLMTMDANTNVIAIYEDGETDVSYVIFYGDALNATGADTSTVYYLSGRPSVKNADGSYEASVYNMDDLAAGKTTISLNSRDYKGFYKISSTDSDGVVDFGDTAAATDLTSPSTDTGYAALTITSSKSGRMTATGTTGCTDIDYSKAMIIDQRSDDDKELDYYGSDIDSVSAMEAALKDGHVMANAYFVEGKPTFIAVQSAQNRQWDITAAVFSSDSASIGAATIQTSATTIADGESFTVTVAIPAGVAITDGNNVATLKLSGEVGDKTATGSAVATAASGVITGSTTAATEYSSGAITMTAVTTGNNDEGITLTWTITVTEAADVEDAIFPIVKLN